MDRIRPFDGQKSVKKWYFRCFSVKFSKIKIFMNFHEFYEKPSMFVYPRGPGRWSWSPTVVRTVPTYPLPGYHHPPHCRCSACQTVYSGCHRGSGQFARLLLVSTFGPYYTFVINPLLINTELVEKPVINKHGVVKTVKINRKTVG